MTLLVEKYRPKGLEEAFFHKNQANRLKKQITRGKLPHLIITGQKDSVKQNLLNAIASTVFGKNYKNNIEYCSVEEYFSTKAKTLREHPEYQRYFSEAKEEKKRIYDKYNIDKRAGRTSKEEAFKQYIKSISRSAPVGKNDYRLFVLFEADRLTQNIQNSLRRIMENYSSTTRYIFDLESSENLIEPLRSRCYTINLSKPTKREIKKKLRQITKEENIDIDEDTLEALLYVTNHDYLDSLNIIDVLNSKGKQKIQIEDIKELSKQISLNNYEKSIKNALKGETKKSIQLIDELIYEKNIKYKKLIEEWRKTIHNLSIDSETKKELIKKLATLDKEIQQLPRDPNQMKKLGRTLYEKYLSSISPK
ncbi:hypothetical protein C9439_00610 [archaeon SCG-AAA382B04]|nr:hypothetical protein C9439_00610 [archaeon SCG-AAA382B04]